MGSLSANGIPVVPKENVTYRNIGQSITATSGLIPNNELAIVRDIPDYARSSAEFGTQPSISGSQVSTVEQSSAQKVTESITDTLVERTINTFEPTAVDQPEIALIPVRSRWTKHNSNKICVNDSELDAVISREDNTNFRPPQ